MTKRRIILSGIELNIEKIKEICSDKKRHYGEIIKEGRGCEGPLRVYFYLKEENLFGEILSTELPFRDKELEGTMKILIEP